MAAAVCEQVEQGPPAWRALEVAIVPGITAMLAVAARVGAPLGHDFCAVSLSDNLKPWPVIERRLDAAAQAGFVIALYNPVSQARPWQLATAFERLRGHLPATTPTVFGRAVGRADESIVVTTLASCRSGKRGHGDPRHRRFGGDARRAQAGPRSAGLYAPFDRERARMIEPRHRVIDGLDGRRRRQSGTAQHDHRGRRARAPPRSCRRWRCRRCSWRRRCRSRACAAIRDHLLR